MATSYTQREYKESDAVKKYNEQLAAQNAAKPQDYTSRWQPQIDSTLDQILNRKDFQYDVNGDALYQQYKDRYVNLGRQAMMDTMGQAATLTGGYGNSYAQMAGQQAYQGYLQGLTDKIPELYQLAYDRYNQQGQDLYNRYGLLGSQEENEYNRWMNNYNLWNSERDWLAGRYDTERGYDYGMHRDTVGDDQWKAQFDEDIRRFDFANKLGEFAPVPVAGGGGSSGGGPGGPRDIDNPTDKSQWGAGQWEAYISAIAQSNGSAAAGREMSNALKTGEMPQQYAGLVQMATKNTSGKPAASSPNTTTKTTSSSAKAGNSDYIKKTASKY